MIHNHAFAFISSILSIKTFSAKEGQEHTAWIRNCCIPAQIQPSLRAKRFHQAKYLLDSLKYVSVHRDSVQPWHSPKKPACSSQCTQLTPLWDSTCLQGGARCPSPAHCLHNSKHPNTLFFNTASHQAISQPYGRPARYHEKITCTRELVK